MINSLKNPDKNIIPERIGAVSVTIPLSNSKSGLFIMEIWKDIEDYEGYYQVSNLSRVKGLHRIVPHKWSKKRTIAEKILTRTINSYGYHTVRLTKNSKGKPVYLHRLIALAFIPNPENKPHINHKNGIKNDNHIENLEWCTQKENIHHAMINGYFNNSGENHYKAKLTEKQVIKIKNNKGKLTIREMAKRHHVNYDCIYRIIKNHTWKHIVIMGKG